MERYYGTILAESVGEKVVVHRADASDLKGKVAEVNQHGCFIIQEDPTLSEEDKDNGAVLKVFVDYLDIRGVGVYCWDLSSQ